MSSIYIQEPATRGKVVIRTDRGPIDVELWPKEAPRTTRNFVQHAVDGYYAGTTFHRLVPGFILQGGDPTGTGHGGEPADDSGAPVPVETHTRLRFARRGLVAAADGGSQFFLTLDKTPELQGRHSIFGRVVGDSLYNLLDMANQKADANDRPRNPPKIINIHVVDNPFDDVVPRNNRGTSPATSASARAAAAAAASKSHIVGKKVTKRSMALLSFGDDEETAAAMVAPAKKVRSSHDLLDDPSLSSRPVAADEAGKVLKTEKQPGSSSLQSPPRAASPSSPPPPSAPPSPAAETAVTKKVKHSSSEKDKEEKEEKTKGKSKEPKPTKKVPLWQQERDRYAKGKKPPSGSGDVLAALQQFKSKLRQESSAAGDQGRNQRKKKSGGGDDSDAEGEPCMLHNVPGCMSCFDTFGAQDRRTDEGWMAHRLLFPKDRLGKDLLRGKDGEPDDGYMVIDPRTAAAKSIATLEKCSGNSAKRPRPKN